MIEDKEKKPNVFKTDKITEEVDEDKKEKITVNDIPTVLIIVILMLIPITYYLSTKKYTTCYYIMFGYSFFNYVIVYISKIINNKIISIIK